MFNQIINEKDCDKRLVEYLYTEKDKQKFYKKIKDTKFDSRLLSVDAIKKEFIQRNKLFNNDFAFMILNANQHPLDMISVKDRVCNYQQHSFA